MNATEQATHTPGPWDVITRPIGPDTEVAQWRIFDQFNKQIADSPGGPYAFSQANAQLIAAAPDLLAALEAIISAVKDANQIAYTDRLGMDWLALVAIEHNAHAAVAKARGTA